MLNSEYEVIFDALEREEKERFFSSDEAVVDGQKALPQIVVTGRPLRDISADSLHALRQANQNPTMFVRTGEMVHIVTDESGGRSIKTSDSAHLRGRMDRAADYVRLTKEGEQPTAPPRDVVNDILALDSEEWQFPPLEGIVETPILRPDGTVFSIGGYDRGTRVFYAPAHALSVPKIEEAPTSADAKQAVTLLDEVLGEFPYVDPASRANTLALLLTPIVRMAFSGPVPLALVDAPQAGTGKSLLASVIAFITTGQPAAMMSAPKDEEEWRKSITANLSQGSNIVLYDNVQYVLQSASLAMALTSPQWKDRILGLSKTITIPQRSTWIATGNNIRLGGDLPRRCYWIRLDAQISQPWRREGFRHPSLITWVSKRRGELLAALLTIAASWYAAGKPDGPAHQMGSFEDWARTLSGILAHAGVPGFLSNLEELYELADSTTSQWESFLRHLCETNNAASFSVAELTHRLQTCGQSREHLPEELAAAWGTSELASAGFKVKLGKAFRNRAGTRFGGEGLHLNRAGTESRGGQVRWRVSAGMQGLQGLQGLQGSELRSHELISNTTEIQLDRTNLQKLQPCRPSGNKREQAPPHVEPPCYCCKGITFWQHPDGTRVCGTCHPSPQE